MLIKKIISGGQTGVDFIGTEVGVALGAEVGGTATEGFEGIEKKSKETGLFVSRIINDSLRQQFNMVIK